MAEKYFADQFDDEEVLYVFRKHPIVMRKALVLGMVMILLGTLPAAIRPSLGFGWFFGGIGIGIILAVLIMLPHWISWHYSVFIVTDQRLIQITQKGFLHRSVVDMSLNQIQMVNYEISGLEQTLLGFGTIVMQTFVGDLVIHLVSHPAKIQKKLLEVLRDKGVNAISYAPEADVPQEGERFEEEDEAEEVE
jgi:hypothetical protein